MDGCKELTSSEQKLYDELCNDICMMALDEEQAESVIEILDKLIAKLMEGCIR